MECSLVLCLPSWQTSSFKGIVLTLRKTLDVFRSSTLLPSLSPWCSCGRSCWAWYRLCTHVSAGCPFRLLIAVADIPPALTLRAFWIRRVQLRELLSSSPSISISRYFRLMLLSCLEMGLTVPLGVYTVYINVSGKHVQPWISWSDTHYDFGNILFIPAVYWRADHQATIVYEMGRWIYPCAAILFFCLFGFAEEARRHYRAAFWWVVKPFGLRPKPVGKTPLSSGYRCVP